MPLDVRALRDRSAPVGVSSIAGAPGAHRDAPISDGYTLVELLLTIGILGLIAMLIIPLAGLYVRSTLRDETRSEMVGLARAVVEYTRDTGSGPKSLAHLWTAPDDATSWRGPYLGDQFDDASEVNDGFLCDAWLEEYVIDSSDGGDYVIRSCGENSIDELGLGDDLEVRVNTNVVLARITDMILAEINNVVVLYNATHLPDEPLTGDIGAVVGQLQSAGLIAADATTVARYSADAWGNPLVVLGSPATEITSTKGD